MLPGSARRPLSHSADEASMSVQGLMYEMTAFVTWTREANPAIVGELYESKLDESVSLQRLTEAQQLNMLVRPPLPEGAVQPLHCTRSHRSSDPNQLTRAPWLTDLPQPGWPQARSAAECDRC